MDDLKVKCLIDLRSPAELEEDEHLHASSVYDGVVNYKFDKKKLEWKAEGVTANGGLQEVQQVAPHTENGGRKRFFVSLMSESLIKKGVFFRFRKRIRVSDPRHNTI